VRDFRPERGGTAVIPDVPSPDDLQKIFDALPTVATKKAFYALLALGCRVGSFCELMCEDTGVDGQIAFKREVKAGWQYRRPLPAFPFRLPERGVLFPDDRGVKWNHSTLFHRIVKACGVAKVERINVHSLRHCFATYHLAAGESSFDVMRYGGWRTLAMMTKYADQGREYGGLIARGRAEGRADGYLPLWPVGGDEAIKDDEKEDED
jgi:integrase